MPAQELCEDEDGRCELHEDAHVRPGSQLGRKTNRINMPACEHCEDEDGHCELDEDGHVEPGNQRGEKQQSVL